MSSNALERPRRAGVRAGFIVCDSPRRKGTRAAASQLRVPLLFSVVVVRVIVHRYVVMLVFIAMPVVAVMMHVLAGMAIGLVMMRVLFGVAVVTVVVRVFVRMAVRGVVVLVIRCVRIVGDSGRAAGKGAGADEENGCRDSGPQGLGLAHDFSCV